MVDITLQVSSIGTEKGKILSGVKSLNIAIWVIDHYECIEPIGSARCGFIHITDVPNKVIPKLKRFISSHWGLHPTEPLDSYNEPNIVRLIRRKWFVDLDSLSNNKLNKLLSIKEVTIEWTKFKLLVLNKAEANRIMTDSDFDD